jgi:tetratricopeptide (TPR) repeat protein
MKYLLELLAVLGFRRSALRALASRQALAGGLGCLAVGFLVFALIRSSVYAEPHEPGPTPAISLISSFMNLNVVQVVLFLSLVYVPSLVCLSNAFAGDGLGFTVSRKEYRDHMSALLPLWGLLMLLTAPLQRFFFVLGNFFGISVGLLALILLTAVYTVWAIRELNYVSTHAAIVVYVASWLTLPIYYVLTTFIFALPFFILFPLLYVFFHRLRDYASARGGEREFQEHLRSLTVNPQDADAQHQLGLIYLKRSNLAAAESCFLNAQKIDPSDPDYCYYLGRVFESRENWPKALEQYEETYRLDSGYALGDIFREVGKGYLHTGRLEKAIEFLQYFLQTRSSDPEGRYWLAVALQRAGDAAGMQGQLHTILEQARSNPRFFRKENRQWISRARSLLRR